MDKTTEDALYWGFASLAGAVIVGQSGLFGKGVVTGGGGGGGGQTALASLSISPPSASVPPGTPFVFVISAKDTNGNPWTGTIYVAPNGGPPNPKFPPVSVVNGTGQLSVVDVTTLAVWVGDNPIFAQMVIKAQATYFVAAPTMGGFIITVVDPNGSPVGGATVIVQNPSTGVVVFQSVTGANGVADSGLTIPPGSYTVQATSPNFAGAFTTQTIVVGVDTPVRIQLVPGPPPPSQEMLFVSLSVNAGGGVAVWKMNPNWPSGDTVAAFITLINAIGQTIGIGRSAFQAIGPGQTASFPVSFGGNVPSGSYTANTFVINQQNAAVSGSVGQPVTI